MGVDPSTGGNGSQDAAAQTKTSADAKTLDGKPASNDAVIELPPAAEEKKDSASKKGQGEEKAGLGNFFVSASTWRRPNGSSILM